MVAWKRFSLALLSLICGGVVAFMLYNLNRYENAVTCATPTIKSRDCIAYSPAVIVDKRTETYSRCAPSPGDGCVDDYNYYVDVMTEGGRATFHLGSYTNDLKVSDKVEMVSWAGQTIAIRAHGRVIDAHYWDPDLIGVSLITVILLLATSVLLAVFGEAPYSWIQHDWWAERRLGKVFGVLLLMLLLVFGQVVIFGIFEGLWWHLLV